MVECKQCGRRIEPGNSGDKCFKCLIRDIDANNAELQATHQDMMGQPRETK